MEIKLKDEMKKLKPEESIVVKFNETETKPQLEVEPEDLKTALANLEPGESLIVRF